LHNLALFIIWGPPFLVFFDPQLNEILLLLTYPINTKWIIHGWETHVEVMSTSFDDETWNVDTCVVGNSTSSPGVEDTIRKDYLRILSILLSVVERSTEILGSIIEIWSKTIGILTIFSEFFLVKRIR